MKPAKILAFAGSTRSASLNKLLVHIAAEGARSGGATVTVLDLRDYPMPLYDGDLEEKEGLPENAKKLKTVLLEHDALLISSPEYNSSITPVLKNAIDWASRTETEDEKALACFRGKVAGLISASPSGFGGLRGLVPLRSILGNIGVTVVPDQVCISSAHEAFTEAGQLKDERKQKQVLAFGKSLAGVAAKLAAE